MGELDLDELDKAVHSLMTDGTAQKQVQPPQGVVESEKKPLDTPMQGPGVRRKGQFMDVMHPTQGTDRVAQASRPDTATEAQPTTTAPAQEEQPQQPEQEATKPETETYSPFIPDAKVEKRPLGATTTSTELVEGEDTPLPEKPMYIPPEYDRSLLAIESDGLHQLEVEEAPMAAPEPIAPVPAESTASTPVNTIPPRDNQLASVYENHELIAAQAKKKAKSLSAFQWILTIIISLVIGIAGGAAAYYFLHGL